MGTRYTLSKNQPFIIALLLAEHSEDIHTMRPDRLDAYKYVLIVQLYGLVSVCIVISTRCT